MEKYYEAEEILKLKTPFWIQIEDQGTEVREAYIIKVTKDPANIMFRSLVEVYKDKTYFHKGIRIFACRKWNKIKVMDRLPSEDLRRVIVDIFIKDMI